MPPELTASIALITYNQEAYIRQTVDSLLKQRTDFNFEIVVGEDASTDATRLILEEYRDRYPGKLSLMPEAPNKGLLLNFRDTLKACRGKYIAICAGDDYWHDENKLQKQVTFLEGNPSFVLTHTDVDFYFEKNGKTLHRFNQHHQPNIQDGEVFEALLTSRFFIHALTACFRRAAFEQHVDFSLFEREGFAYEDLPTWLSLSRHGQFKYLPDSTSTYRIIDDSVSRPKDPARKIQFLKEHYKIKQYFITRFNVPVETADSFAIYYHRKKFDAAYKWNFEDEAEESYQFLRTKGKAGQRLYLKRMLLRYPSLKKSIGRLRKMMQPTASVADS
ncbi:glycosyltransferase [Nostoc ellipsosporum NOK]|nr:glycosyltransferase [Nostoc ellipsosporum NOK]